MANDDYKKGRTTTERGRTSREASRQTILGHAVVGGLIAGAVFAIAQMIGSTATGTGVGYPWQLFASILLGAAAFEALTTGVFLVGFVVHFVLAAIIGLIWGLVASGVPKGVRDNLGTHAAVGGIYGLAIWVVTFQLIARAFYPWFLEPNQLVQALAHVLFFGVPLGLYLAARLGYVESEPVRREAPTRA